MNRGTFYNPMQNRSAGAGRVPRRCWQGKTPGHHGAGPVCEYPLWRVAICAGRISDLRLERQTALTLIYKVVGRGRLKWPRCGPDRRWIFLIRPGKRLSIWRRAGDAPLLIGGGVGIPPLYGLCQPAAGSGTDSQRVILGFNTAADVFY